VFNALRLFVEVFAKLLAELFTEILAGVKVSLVVYYLDFSVS
jgi:hypothetical protein